MSDQEESIESISKPSFFWLMTEASRALFEFSTFYPYKLLRGNESSGDGHSVLVLPGFMATDRSTSPLRKFLIKLGYDAHGWENGRNYGSEVYIDLLLEKVVELFEESGEKISIIGWSLGGVYARQIAKQRPDLIRQVITLGSPFRGIDMPNHAEWVYKFLTNGKSSKDIDPLVLQDIPNPAPVPTTAIYTKEDGVVPWQICMEKQESSIHQNVQVRGSHFGLGVNPSVLAIIMDRLQYCEENWQPFVPGTRIREFLFYPSV